jgi:hypothetical protein
MYHLCTNCTGYHTKTQLFQETCPSGGSYLLGTSLVTFPSPETINIKNCQHGNLQKSWKFMHTTSRRTPLSRPRGFLPTRNYATDTRNTLSRHAPTYSASPQLLSARNIYPSREAYRTFVHTRQNALKTAQRFPNDRHYIPVFDIV